jgi:Spy/CpxP family protein refolding chaperone
MNFETGAEKTLKIKGENMKRNLITLAAALSIISGGFIVAYGQSNSGSAAPNAKTNSNASQTAAPSAPTFGFGQGQRFTQRLSGNSPSMLERFTDKLNLTPEQKAKMQPIFDQTKPQLQQIREEAMQKTHAVIEGTMGQIRAMLTPEQQAKFDEMRQAHENARDAMQKMRDTDGE